MCAVLWWSDGEGWKDIAKIGICICMTEERSKKYLLWRPLTSSIANIPRWQSVWGSRSIENTDILRCQEFHKFGIFKITSLTAKNRSSLIRDVDNFPSNQRNSYSKHILKRSLKFRQLKKQHILQSITYCLDSEIKQNTKIKALIS